VEKGDFGTTSDRDGDEPGRGLGWFAGVGVLVVAVSAIVAGATIWLLLSNPVVVANAVNDGEITPLVQELALALYDAFLSLLRFF
jgi:hypothetical protein